MLLHSIAELFFNGRNCLSPPTADRLLRVEPNVVILDRSGVNYRTYAGGVQNRLLESCYWCRCVAGTDAKPRHQEKITRSNPCPGASQKAALAVAVSGIFRNRARSMLVSLAGGYLDLAHNAAVSYQLKDEHTCLILTIIQ